MDSIRIRFPTRAAPFSRVHPNRGGRDSLWCPPMILRVLVPLALVSCTSIDEAGDSSSPSALAPAWISPAARGDVVPTRWWLALGGEDLDALVDEALTHNADLAVSAARLRVVTADLRAAGAARLPSVDLSAGAGRRRQNFIGFPIPGSGSGALSSTYTSYDAGVVASWEPDLWDRLGSAERAALRDQEAAVADLAGARESIAAAVVRAWLVCREAGLHRESVRGIQEAWRRNEQVILERYEGGLADAQALRLARSNTHGAASVVAAAGQAHAAARRRLEHLLGRHPAGELSAGPGLEVALSPVPAGLPIELLGRRPDLVAAHARFEAARHRAGAARADLWPRITLTGDAGGVSDQVGDLLDGDYSVWGLAARLTAPLFDGGRRRAVIEGADAATDQAAAGLASAVLTAAFEVELALAAEVELQERARQSSLAAGEAARSAELAADRYRAGVIDVTALLELQRLALAAEDLRMAARRDLWLNRVDLHLALGGGFGEGD